MAKTVSLIGPDGVEYAVSSPLVLNQLHFGFGYRLPDGLSAVDAIAQLGEADESQPEPEPEPGPAPKRRPKETPAGDDAAGDSNTD
jgi:hypothetical protein